MSNNKQSTVLNLDALQSTVGYRFKNVELLERALCHKSYAHEKKVENNERLEFLGDAVLQFVMSDQLMTLFPLLSEGFLSKFRAVLVSEKGLSKVAKQIELGQFLRIGKGEEMTGGRKKPSILSDAMEALFAAVYLDSKEKAGASEVSQMIVRLFKSEIKEAEKTFSSVDYKTDLQEYVQKNKCGDLVYQVLSETGPDHAKQFKIAILIRGKQFGTGMGRSKKAAEQEAAVAALQQLKGKYGS